MSDSIKGGKPWQRQMLIACLICADLVSSLQVDPPRSLVASVRTPARSSINLVRGEPGDWVPHVQTGGDPDIRNIDAELKEFDFRSLAADYRTNKVMAVDHSEANLDLIVMVDVEKVTADILSTKLSKETNVLAVDWLNRNVYWIDKDPRANHIAMVSYRNGGSQLIHTNLDTPVTLAVDPLKGLLFWIEGSTSQSIKRSSLIGNDVRTIVESDITRAVAMAIDNQRHMLLWVDEGRRSLEAADYNGGQRQTIWQDSILQQGYVGLDVFEDFVFLLKSQTNQVTVVSYTNSTRITDLNLNPLGSNGVTSHGLTMMAPERQPDSQGACDTDNGGCQHLCVHDPLSGATCLCRFGFELQHDGSTCKSTLVNDNFILMTDTHGEVFQLDLTTGKVRALPVDFHSNPIALIYHPLKQYVYWTDVQTKELRRASLDGNINEVVFSLPPTSVPDGLAFDLNTYWIYFTDAGRKTVSSFDGQSITDIVDTGDQSQPRDIILDILQRLMYWTDWGDQPRIERANMADGSNRQALVTTGLVWPNGLAIDFTEHLMYWCDASTNKIERANLDGSDRTALLQDGYDSHFFGLTLDARFLYFTDWTKRYLRRMDRQTLKMDTLGPAFFGRLNDAHLYNSSFLNLGVLGPGPSLPPTTASVTPDSGTSRPTTTQQEPPITQVDGTSDYGDPSDSTDIIIIGVVVAGVVVITLIVTVGVIMGMKRRRSNQPAVSVISPVETAKVDDEYITPSEVGVYEGIRDSQVRVFESWHSP